LFPTLIVILPEADPEFTEVPLTVIVERESVRVGVTVIEDTPFATVIVYAVVPEEKVGLNVPSDTLRLEIELIELRVELLVIVIVY